MGERRVQGLCGKLDIQRVSSRLPVAPQHGKTRRAGRSQGVSVLGTRRDSDTLGGTSM